MTWQPIETAPKDASSILIYDGKFVERVAWYWIDRPHTCGWWAIQGGDDAVAFSDYSDTRAKVDEEEATHWMPLPEPPAT
jgi:hypothetical protein